MTEKLFSTLQYYYGEMGLTAKNYKNHAKLLELFLYYCNKHSKCYVLRFDFHFPQHIDKQPLTEAQRELYADPSKRKEMRMNTLSYFIKKLKRKKLDPFYLCACERSQDASYEHYHLLLLLDGNKTNNVWGHLEELTKIWSGNLGLSTEENGGLVQKSKIRNKNDGSAYNGCCLTRTFADFLFNLLEVLNFSKYLLKPEGKENVAFRKKITGSSIFYADKKDNPGIFAKNLLNSCRLKKEMDFSAYHFLDEKFKNVPWVNLEMEDEACFSEDFNGIWEFEDYSVAENLPIQYTTFDDDTYGEKIEENLLKAGHNHNELSVFSDNSSQFADDHPLGEDIEFQKNGVDLRLIGLKYPENFHEDDSPFLPADSDFFDVPFEAVHSFEEFPAASVTRNEPHEEDSDEYYLELARSMTFSKKEKECYLEDPEAEQEDYDEDNSYEWSNSSPQL